MTYYIRSSGRGGRAASVVAYGALFVFVTATYFLDRAELFLWIADAARALCVIASLTLAPRSRLNSAAVIVTALQPMFPAYRLALTALSDLAYLAAVIPVLAAATRRGAHIAVALSFCVWIDSLIVAFAGMWSGGALLTSTHFLSLIYSTLFSANIAYTTVYLMRIRPGKSRFRRETHL